MFIIRETTNLTQDHGNKADRTLSKEKFGQNRVKYYSRTGVEHISIEISTKQTRQIKKMQAKRKRHWRDSTVAASTILDIRL